MVVYVCTCVCVWFAVLGCHYRACDRTDNFTVDINWCSVPPSSLPPLLPLNASYCPAASDLDLVLPSVNITSHFGFTTQQPSVVVVNELVWPSNATLSGLCCTKLY
jgi:hypothetical protein